MRHGEWPKHERRERGEQIVARLQALAGEGTAGRIAAGAGWKTLPRGFQREGPGGKGRGDRGLGRDPALSWRRDQASPTASCAEGETPRDAVLVASKDLVMRVFDDRDDNYSMCGQMARMKQSFGEIYPRHRQGPRSIMRRSQHQPAIMAISERKAFTSRARRP